MTSKSATPRKFAIREPRKLSSRQIHYQWAIHPKLIYKNDDENSKIANAISKNVKTVLNTVKWNDRILRQGLFDVARLVDQHRDARERDKKRAKAKSIKDVAQACKALIAIMDTPFSNKDNLRNRLRASPISGTVSDPSMLVETLKAFQLLCLQIQSEEPTHTKQARRDVHAAIGALIDVWENATKTKFKSNFEQPGGTFKSAGMVFLSICFKHFFPNDPATFVKSSAKKILHRRPDRH